MGNRFANQTSKSESFIPKGVKDPAVISEIQENTGEPRRRGHFNKKAEKRALIRILVDNIKADKVIDSREIEEYEEIKKRYNLSRADELCAYGMTLGEAISIIQECDEEERLEILRLTGILNDSDGFRPREEALFALAMTLCLNTDDPEERADILSYEIDPNWFDHDQVLYVESGHDIAINAAIEKNLRIINSEMMLCGFNFVYIPMIARHYVDTPREIVKSMVSMIAPYLGGAETENFLTVLKLYKTDNFCVRQLAEKLGMMAMRDTNPSLLFRINNSKVGEKFVANFLRIPVERDIIERVREVCDMFLGFHSSDREVISLKRDHEGRFLFSGFYRQLLEIMLLRKKKESKVVLDLLSYKISFPGAVSDVAEDGVVSLSDIVRKEKSLFALFIYERANGPVSFRISDNPVMAKKNREKISALQKKFNVIYRKFGGDPEKAPDLSNGRTRSPMMTKIRKSIENIANDIDDVDELMINKFEDGSYGINAPLDRFVVREAANPEGVPFIESNLYKSLKELEK